MAVEPIGFPNFKGKRKTAHFEQVGLCEGGVRCYNSAMPSLLTNPIETGNTVAAINIVRKELTKILHVVNIVVQVLVLPYYIYLIYKNWSDVFYMVVYGLMLLVSVAAFIIELILDGRLKKKEDKAKKVAEKNKRINSYVFKAIKYVVRFLILAVAIIQIATKETTAIYVVTTALSGILIVGQIVLDIFVMLALRYFEFIRLGFETDLRESPILNLGKSEQVVARKLEAEAEAMGLDEKVKSEKAKLALIKEEMAKNKEESKRKAQEQIEHRSQFIRRQKYADAVKGEEIQTKINTIYQKKLKEADKYLSNEKKLVALLAKAEASLGRIPTGLDGLSALKDMIPDFGTLEPEWQGKFVAALLYYLDPFTAILDIRGEIGYADDEYVAEMFLKERDEK